MSRKKTEHERQLEELREVNRELRQSRIELLVANGRLAHQTPPRNVARDIELVRLRRADKKTWSWKALMKRFHFKSIVATRMAYQRRVEFERQRDEEAKRMVAQFLPKSKSRAK